MGPRWLKARAYVELVKPRVALGTVALFLASVLSSARMEGAALDPLTVAASTAAAASLIAGASAFNEYFDRDIDALMHRTRGRPLPSGRLKESEALAVSLALIGASLATLSYVAPSTLGVALLALASYIGAYTCLLKRRTGLAVLSGSPGCASPVLAGWLIGAGRLTPAALLYASVAALWLPVHFWSLAILFEEDYRRAQVPTLPSSIGAEASARVVASTSMAVALLAWAAAVLGGACSIGLASTTALNAALLALAVGLSLKPRSEGRAWRLFKYSSPYVVPTILSSAA
jgi:protoheme IX farnesyltransferase